MKRDCPEYRLRLFLSVDLVGSTKFKFSGGRQQPEGEVDPLWVKQIKLFYKSIPEIVTSKFESEAVSYHELGPETAPKVWKTIGDEIVFCCRIKHMEHLAVCVFSFLSALEDYGKTLDEGKHLDLKGTGWIAAFPEPNITVAIPKWSATNHNDLDTGNSTDETFEFAADQNPNQYDFLGTNIDSGFRVSRHARPDTFAATVELAYLLSECTHRKMRPFSFTYSGRQILKGVLEDRPYPVIGVDTERSLSRREVRAREKALGINDGVEALSLHDFLKAFMNDEDVSVPVLLCREDDFLSLPPSYLAYQERWKQDEQEPDPAAREDGPSGDLQASGTEIPINVALDAEKIAERAEHKS